jgi:hypothetical protein
LENTKNGSEENEVRDGESVKEATKESEEEKFDSYFAEDSAGYGERRYEKSEKERKERKGGKEKKKESDNGDEKFGSYFSENSIGYGERSYEKSEKERKKGNNGIGQYNKNSGEHGERKYKKRDQQTRERHSENDNYLNLRNNNENFLDTSRREGRGRKVDHQNDNYLNLNNDGRIKTWAKGALKVTVCMCKFYEFGLIRCSSQKGFPHI